MIYFLRRGDGAIKIGYSSDVLKRKTVLEVEHGSLEILGVTQGNRSEEQVLHKQFSLYRLGRSEWFSPSNEILDYIEANTSLEIPKPPNLWTTIAVSRRFAFVVKTLAASLNMSVDDLIWKVLYKTYPDKMILIEQLLATEVQPPPHEG